MKKIFLLAVLLSNVAFAQLGVGFIWVKADTFRTRDASSSVVFTYKKNTGSEILMSSSDAIFKDYRATKKGLEYAADYSANATSRTLTDVAHVNSLISSNIASYVPGSRTITINGVTQDLTSNRSWTIPGTTYTAGTGINVAGTVISNTAPDQTVSLTAGRGIAITGTYPNFTIAMVTPTITVRNATNGNARSVNSNFTVNATKEAFVSYSLTCSVTNPLLVGTSTATAFLEYSTDSGTTWQAASQAGNSSGVGVTVTIQLTNGQTGVVSGYIPANALVRIRTTTSATASVTYVTGQEVVY